MVSEDGAPISDSGVATMNGVLKFYDGGIERHEQVYAIQVEQVCAEVEAEFAEQLAGASFWQRVKLRREIRREVARRLPKPPSLRNLYGKSR
jgi:hypothetical protein